MSLRSMLLLTLIPVLAASCGGPKEPAEVVEAMFRAAQEGDHETMLGYMSPEVQAEMNLEALEGIEIISYAIDAAEISDDGNRADVEFTVTLRNITTGEIEVEDDEMELLRTASGDWYIVDM